MEIVKARRFNFTILEQRNAGIPIYPLLRDMDGEEVMYSISPEHGRSYYVGQTDDGRYIVSKGNGLSYSQFCFLNTHEMGDGSWGLLLREDAIRDYRNGVLAESLGIKTNKMHCVIELDKTITIDSANGIQLRPVLLQYDVECPFRISDTPFIQRSAIKKEAIKWRYGDFSTPRHIIAAEVLIKNLSILHTKGFLHNAISVHNYTWALELLDFELSRSRDCPLSSGEEELISSAFPREAIYTYQIINYIARALNEHPDFSLIDDMFRHYGFDLKKYNCD